MAWDTGQPRDAIEKGDIAAEAMGGKTRGNKPRAPKFHRMSIAAAENGVTVEHTVKVKRGKTVGRHGEYGGASTPTSGDDMTEKDTKFVFGHDHPVMHHINAIHDHMSKVGGGEDNIDPTGD